MLRRIISFDLGAHTGYSEWNITESSFALNKSGSFHIKEKDPGRHYDLYIRELLKVIDPRDSDHVPTVYYEKVMAHVGVHASHRYGAYEALLQMAMAQLVYDPPLSVHVGTWKKQTIGNGKANKAEINQFVIDFITNEKEFLSPNYPGGSPNYPGRYKLKQLIKDQDQCDAIAIGLYACKLHELNREKHNVPS